MFSFESVFIYNGAERSSFKQVSADPQKIKYKQPRSLFSSSNYSNLFVAMRVRSQNQNKYGRGCLRGIYGIAFDHISLPPEFESRRVHI